MPTPSHRRNISSGFELLTGIWTFLCCIRYLWLFCETQIKYWHHLYGNRGGRCHLCDSQHTDSGVCLPTSGFVSGVGRCLCLAADCWSVSLQCAAGTGLAGSGQVRSGRGGPSPGGVGRLHSSPSVERGRLSESVDCCDYRNRAIFLSCGVCAPGALSMPFSRAVWGALHEVSCWWHCG